MGVKEYQFAGDNRHLLNEYHRQLDSLGEWIIQFDAFDKQDYGFDIVSNKKGIFSGAEYYPYLSANYDLRYKSVETGKSDKVKVDFGSYPKDSVIFKDKYGVKLKFTDKNILTFTGTNQADTNYIYAYHGDQKIGKLMLNVYKKKPIKVCLVMVNGAHHKESFSEIKKYLDKVYKPAVVDFEVVSANFKMPELTSFSHGGSPWNSVYNDDQKRVLRAYNDSIKDGIYYLFFIDNVTDKKDGSGTLVSGYMPRGYNCGFIYDGGSPHTIAHELGHGIAGLEHVFENSKSSGKTNNLMDYASGEELWHFQWDAIQDPSRVWMKWNKDESEGELINPAWETVIVYNVFGFSFSTYCALLVPLFDPLAVDLLWKKDMSYYAERKTFSEFEKLGIYTPSGYHDLFPQNNHIHVECGGFQNGFGSVSHKGNSLLQILKREEQFKKYANSKDIIDKIKKYDEKSEEEVRKIYQTGGLLGSSNVLSKEVSEVVTKSFYETGEDLEFDESHSMSKNLHYNIVFQRFFYKKIVDYIYNNINNKTALINIFKDIKLPNFGLTYIPKLKTELSQDISNIKNIDLQQFLIDLKKGADILYYDYYGLMGGTQKLILDLDIYKRVTKGLYGSYYVADIKLTIQDWYGADFEDFFTSIKSKFDCLNAFFVLQHKFGYKPFKTSIIFHDYILFKK